MGLHNLQLQEPIQAQEEEPVQQDSPPLDAPEADYSLSNADQLIKAIDELLEEDPNGPPSHAVGDEKASRPTNASDPAVIAGLVMAKKDVTASEPLDDDILQLTVDEIDMEFDWTWAMFNHHHLLPPSLVGAITKAMN